MATVVPRAAIRWQNREMSPVSTMLIISKPSILVSSLPRRGLVLQGRYSWLHRLKEKFRAFRASFQELDRQAELDSSGFSCVSIQITHAPKIPELVDIFWWQITEAQLKLAQKITGLYWTMEIKRELLMWAPNKLDSGTRLGSFCSFLFVDFLLGENMLLSPGSGQQQYQAYLQLSKPSCTESFSFSLLAPEELAWLVLSAMPGIFNTS